MTPSDVAEAIIAFVTAPGAPQRVWLCDFRPDHVRAQAAAATARYAARAPVSVLDGVPFAVKDSVGAYAHTMGHGTTFLGNMCAGLVGRGGAPPARPPPCPPARLHARLPADFGTIHAPLSRSPNNLLFPQWLRPNRPHPHPANHPAPMAKRTRRGPVAEVAHEAPAVAALRSLGAICIGGPRPQHGQGVVMGREGPCPPPHCLLPFNAAGFAPKPPDPTSAPPCPTPPQPRARPPGKTQMQASGLSQNAFSTQCERRRRANRHGCSIRRVAPGVGSTPATCPSSATPLISAQTTRPPQEFGVLPTGISSKQGLARNPFDARRIVGGSRCGRRRMTSKGAVVSAPTPTSSAQGQRSRCPR